jgi:hypothetical protein
MAFTLTTVVVVASIASVAIAVGVFVGNLAALWLVMRNKATRVD